MLFVRDDVSADGEYLLTATTTTCSITPVLLLLCTTITTYVVLRAGPAEVLIFLLIGDAPNIIYWHVLFLHRVDHAPTNKRKTHLFIFLDVFEGHDRCNDPKKY